MPRKLDILRSWLGSMPGACPARAWFPWLWSLAGAGTPRFLISCAGGPGLVGPALTQASRKQRGPRGGALGGAAVCVVDPRKCACRGGALASTAAPTVIGFA